MIEANVIHAAWRVGRREAPVPRLVLHLSQARAAADERGRLLTGPLEPTNQWYAIAKIAGIKLCQAYRRQYGCDFISAMPTNLYGPGDNFDLKSSHVLPALIAKMHACQADRRGRGRDLGHRPAAARVPARRRPGRRLRPSARGLQRGGARQRRQRRGSDHRRARRDGARAWSASRAGCASTATQPDGTPRKLLDIARLTRARLAAADRARGRSPPTPIAGIASGWCPTPPDRCAASGPCAPRSPVRDSLSGP